MRSKRFMYSKILVLISNRVSIKKRCDQHEGQTIIKDELVYLSNVTPPVACEMITSFRIIQNAIYVLPLTMSLYSLKKGSFLRESFAFICESFFRKKRGLPGTTPIVLIQRYVTGTSHHITKSVMLRGSLNVCIITYFHALTNICNL